MKKFIVEVAHAYSVMAEDEDEAFIIFMENPLPGKDVKTLIEDTDWDEVTHVYEEN